MSTRTPMNEHAAAAQAQAAAQAEAAQAQGGSGFGSGRKRPARKPFGAREQKLAYPNREGYHRHWFNDEPGRIARAIEAGYTHVKDEGKNVSTNVGVARGGGGLLAYLMEIPLEWYREDMAAQEAEHQSIIGQIKQGRVPGGPTGEDGSAQYVPRERGINIRDERR